MTTKEQTGLHLEHYQANPARERRAVFLDQPIHVVVKREVPFWVWALAACASGAVIVYAATLVLQAL